VAYNFLPVERDQSFLLPVEPVAETRTVALTEAGVR
jgi:hypothetical protein